MSIKYYPHEYHQLLNEVEEFENKLKWFTSDYVDDLVYFRAHRDMLKVLSTVAELNISLKEYILINDKSEELLEKVKDILWSLEKILEEFSFKLFGVDGIIKDNINLWKIYEGIFNTLKAKSAFNDLWHLDLEDKLEVIEYRRERWNHFTETEDEE